MRRNDVEDNISITNPNFDASRIAVRGSSTFVYLARTTPTIVPPPDLTIDFVLFEVSILTMATRAPREAIEKKEKPPESSLAPLYE